MLGILVIVNVNDKSCDFSEYLDYKNCQCRKRLADKLIDEWDKNIDEVKIFGENKYSSWILHIVLFSIFFTINAGIDDYFVYYKYVNHNKENISKYDYVYQTENY